MSIAQEINLFQPGLRAPLPALSARLILRALGGVVLALVLVYGFARQRAGTETQIVSRLEAEKSRTTARLEELERQVAARVPDPALAVEVRDLAVETEARRVLVKAVEKRALGTARGFSPQLEGLAKRTLDGVWLGRISIERGGEGLAISGHALDAKLVPEWLERMREEPGLAGRAFQTVRIEKTAPKKDARPGVIDFALATGDEVPQ
jgi:Fimbrial assembly protein (PilN)